MPIPSDTGELQSAALLRCPCLTQPAILTYPTGCTAPLSFPCPRTQHLILRYGTIKRDVVQMLGLWMLRWSCVMWPMAG